MAKSWTEVELVKPAVRGESEPGMVSVRLVATSKQRAIHGRKRLVKTAASATDVVRMEVRPGRRLFLIETPEEGIAGFRRMINRVVRVANVESPAAVERALVKILPAASAAEPAVETWRETEAVRWAEIRKEWLQQHPAFTAVAIAKLAGSGTVNPSALVTGWVSAKRVFSLQDGKRRLYPGFQIGQDGQPKPAFRMLLKALQGKLEGWPLAIWLTSPNSELDDWKSPLDVIDHDPDAVVAAALYKTSEASH